jgi:hypothetical protein
MDTRFVGSSPLMHHNPAIYVDGLAGDIFASSEARNTAR